MAVATAQAAYGGMLLSRWAARDLDDWELTRGRGVDPRRVLPLITKARDLFTQVLSSLEPLQREIADGRPDSEDSLLATGLLDIVPRLMRDARFNLAWTNLYAATLDPQDATKRTGALESSEIAFRELIDRGGLEGVALTRVRAGLAAVQREQGKYDAALSTLAEAAQSVTDGALLAQLQFERGRVLALAGKLPEARDALQPLATRGENPQSADDAARFYLNLALLWEPYVDLLEAARTPRAPNDSSGKNRTLREQGLQKLARLAARGGPWPRLAQYYAEPVLDPKTPIKDQSAIELLFLGRKLIGENKLTEAIPMLREASRRPEAPAAVTGDALLELGSALAKQGDARGGAEALARLARDYRRHERAAAAATTAQALWTRVAQESGQPADYLALADVLQNIVRNFPEHPLRAEAAWLWPQALQAGGKYTAAAEQFGNVPTTSPHFDEAQHRRLLCLRQALEQDRAQLPPDEYRARTERLVVEFRNFATLARRRAATASQSTLVRDYADSAIISAAELLNSPELARYDEALKVLQEPGAPPASDTLIGRALAARMSALFGLRRFEDAAAEVDHFVKSVSPDAAAGTLAKLGLGLQEEAQKLADVGRAEDARRLAGESLPVFELLEHWAAADASRASLLQSTRFGLASLRLMAGKPAEALPLTRGLVQSAGTSGDVLRLHARVVTALASTDKTQAAPAREAWSVLLRDPNLRSVAPARYWEARYEFLRLLLEEGRKEDVARAIQQERAWYPELGGAPWQERLEALLAAAGGTAATASAPAETQ